MPLQGLVSGPALNRIDKLAESGHAGAKQLSTYWVGQGVGLMNDPLSSRAVVQNFMEDFALAYERFQGFPVATRQVTYLGDIEIVVTTADVRYNVPEADLPDFSPPAAVQALMDELNALPE